MTETNWAVQSLAFYSETSSDLSLQISLKGIWCLSLSEATCRYTSIRHFKFTSLRFFFYFLSHVLESLNQLAYTSPAQFISWVQFQFSFSSVLVNQYLWFSVFSDYNVKTSGTCVQMLNSVAICSHVNISHSCSSVARNFNFSSDTTLKLKHMPAAKRSKNLWTSY